MSRLKKSLFLWAFCHLFIGADAFGSLLVVKNGKPKYAIVVPKSPTSEEFSAADFLQRYILKMTGATLPIVSEAIPPSEREIVLGTTNRMTGTNLANVADTLCVDGYLLKTENERLFVIGGKGKGLFYGIVTVLERYFGCRYYSPGNEYIPQETNLVVPDVCFYDKPVNTYRVVYGNFTADKDYKNWHRLNEIDDVFGEGYYVHTYWKLVPPGKYFQSHPEYFALINGERSASQPCLSNPDVFDIALGNLREEINRQPTRKVWSVSQNDNRRYCQCPLCLKVMEEEGGPSGPIIRFANKMAEQFPDKTISTLAYTYSRRAPLKTRPAKNVQIMLCTIELDRNLPIENAESSQGFVKELLDWRALTGNIYLWDYTVNFSHNISPFPNFHVLQNNLCFFAKNGIKEQFQQSNSEFGYDFAEMKSYLLAKLLWDPYVKSDSVINDFMRGFYGKSGTWVRAYLYQLVRESAKSKQNLGVYDSPIWHDDTFLSEANIKYYKTCFDSALIAAKGDTTLTKRVEVAFLPLQYAVLEIGKKDMYGSRGWFKMENGKSTVRQEIKSDLDKFYYTCRKYGVKNLNEAGLTPKDYYLSTLRFLIPQMDNNMALGKKVFPYPAPAGNAMGGDLSLLTNGFLGTNDCGYQWLGWCGTDFELVLDLGALVEPAEITLSSLNSPVDRAFFPNRIRCSVSENGTDYISAGQIDIDNSDRIDEVTRLFTFNTVFRKIRYVKMSVECTKTTPFWLCGDSEKTWTYIDEVIVKPKKRS